MAFETIRFEATGRIAVITLNRPDSMNTFNILMLQELIGVFETAALDTEIRAVVLTGEGITAFIEKRTPRFTGQ